MQLNKKNKTSKTPKTKEKIKAAEKSLCDQSWDEKARMKKEEKACQWAAQLQEWKPRRNRDFSFLNGDSKNNPPLSSIDCWEHPVEERLNG